MARIMANRAGKIIMLLSVFLGMLAVVFTNITQAATVAYQLSVVQQADEKMIVIKPDLGGVIEINNLAVRNIKLVSGQKYSVSSLFENAGRLEEDWLENLQFSVKNTSNKRVTYVDLGLFFFAPEEQTSVMPYEEWEIGIPPIDPWGRASNGKPLILNPGDSVTLTLPSNDLQKIKKYLSIRGYPLSHINIVKVFTKLVYFDDGLKYLLGIYFRPNPNEPTGYERVKQ